MTASPTQAQTQAHTQTQAQAQAQAQAQTGLMRAYHRTEYGQTDVLTLTQLSRPTVADDGVLVRVVAASLHKGDWHLLTGTPYLIRLAGFGLFRPKQQIPGMAIAGRVEAVGRNVTYFKIGDEVFGELKAGGFAEYVCADAKLLARKPAGVSFEQAASLAVSATTALQGLRDAGKLEAGQSVLINGASGGVGTFAVQIAKALGAEVTGVCGPRNVALVRELGADHVVDYSQTDVTQGTQRYDLILDLVGNHSTAAFRRVLKPQGLLVAVAGGADNPWLGPLVPVLTGLLSNLFSQQRFVPLAAMPKAEDLAIVAELVASGKVKPAIERRFALAEVPEALQLQGQGHNRGKNVIMI